MHQEDKAAQRAADARRATAANLIGVCRAVNEPRPQRRQPRRPCRGPRLFEMLRRVYKIVLNFSRTYLGGEPLDSCEPSARLAMARARAAFLVTVHAAQRLSRPLRSAADVGQNRGREAESSRGPYVLCGVTRLSTRNGQTLRSLRRAGTFINEGLSVPMDLQD